MQLVSSSKFPEADISEEIQQVTGSVGTQTDPFQQDTEEGDNKQYICTGTLTDDILTNQVINNDHSYCTSVEGQATQAGIGTQFFLPKWPLAQRVNCL